MHKTILVTGGCGFIGSALIRNLLTETDYHIVNVDKLTYAGNPDSIASVLPNQNYTFECADICDRAQIDRLLETYKPHAIMHLAAESHVDRSIDNADQFIQTNILGTYTVLEAARAYWQGFRVSAPNTFRFLHISTDEVFGTLGAVGSFEESTPYDPRSPYSASKASSDHLVRAWWHTYGLPVLVTNCSNNYGPCQFPEKLIPVTILNTLKGRPIPVYGNGQNIRDWLYVEDHIRALRLVLNEGIVGETYNIGGGSEMTNLDVVRSICALLDELATNGIEGGHASLIRFVADRPGHDWRYAINCNKIRNDLGWIPQESFKSGLRKTVLWYLNNRTWSEKILSGQYRLGRIGLGQAVT